MAKKWSLKAFGRRLAFNGEFPKVTTVADADHPIRIVVTKRDNSVGVAFDHQRCPLALGCRHLSKRPDAAWVGVATLYLIYGAHAVRYKLAGSTTTEVKMKDRDAKLGFNPGTYGAAPFPPSNRFGVRAKSRGKEGGHYEGPPKRKRGAMRFTEGVR